MVQVVVVGEGGGLVWLWGVGVGEAEGRWQRAEGDCAEASRGGAPHHTVGVPV